MRGARPEGLSRISIRLIATRLHELATRERIEAFRGSTLLS